MSLYTIPQIWIVKTSNPRVCENHIVRMIVFCLCAAVYSREAPCQVRCQTYHVISGLVEEWLCTGREVKSIGVISGLCEGSLLGWSSISVSYVSAAMPAWVMDVPGILYSSPIIRDLVWVGLKCVRLQELPVRWDHVDVSLHVISLKLEFQLSLQGQMWLRSNLLACLICSVQSRLLFFKTESRGILTKFVPDAAL